MDHKDAQLQELMKLAKLDFPFDDFDDQVMHRIEKLEQEKAAISNYRKYSLVFFVLGTLFGLGVNYFLSEAIEMLTMPEAGRRMLTLSTQMVYVVLIVLFSDRILRLLKLSKKTKNSVPV